MIVMMVADVLYLPFLYSMHFFYCFIELPIIIILLFFLFLSPFITMHLFYSPALLSCPYILLFIQGKNKSLLFFVVETFLFLIKGKCSDFISYNCYLVVLPSFFKNAAQLM